MILARKIAQRFGLNPDPHQPAMLPDEETIFLAHHPSHDIDTVTRAMIRDYLSEFEQRICPHRCTEDKVFFKSVQRKCGFNTIRSRSTPFFDGKRNGQSRVWRCETSGRNTKAWIETESDMKMLTVEIRT